MQQHIKIVDCCSLTLIITVYIMSFVLFCVNAYSIQNSGFFYSLPLLAKESRSMCVQPY